ncbi:acyl dehydratase [Mycobacterium uberis]|uniref:Acyl dehydratase n=1 Tax=Mycobacterium uberis TaxID=2162698 RepID=A0A3E1HHX5_9MYCO|nr:MaoC family dehydratase [Mycobacterium uberis]RFD26056.1 acyl dehydratase [Mycobacterium uberis]
MTVNRYAGQREGGPYFDELSIGQVFDWAPATTLTSGMAAVHQAIVGDRMRLTLDAELSTAVIGGHATLVHPGLVCDVAIGQSTLVTQRVKANLFYRNLVFHRFPVIGDTLYTRTEVVGLQANSAKPGRAPTGMAALRVTTIDQDDRLVLDFYRCAMLPTGPTWHPDDALSRNDDLSTVGADVVTPASNPTGQWNAAGFRERVPGPHFDASITGAVLHSTGDIVSSAPELARVTSNIAATHHDSRIGGRRLVYGGHTIGLALAQASRMLPNLATVLGWRSCDHIGPVHEGETLYSQLHVESTEATQQGGVLGLRSLVYAVSKGGKSDRLVLDWRFNALQF